MASHPSGEVRVPMYVIVSTRHRFFNIVCTLKIKLDQRASSFTQSPLSDFILTLFVTRYQNQYSSLMHIIMCINILKIDCSQDMRGTLCVSQWWNGWTKQTIRSANLFMISENVNGQRVVIFTHSKSSDFTLSYVGIYKFYWYYIK